MKCKCLLDASCPLWVIQVSTPALFMYLFTRQDPGGICVSLAPGKSSLLAEPGVTGLVTWTTLFDSLDRLLCMMHTHACSVAPCVRLFVTPGTVANQAPLHRILRQEHWSELLWPPPGDLPDPGIRTRVSYSMKILHALAAEFSTTSDTWEAP